MRRYAHLLLIVACLVMSNGCLARQLKRDGASSQEAISEIYTEQAMNNLIRARNNMPFVQLKYSALTVNDNDEYAGGFNFTRDVSTVADLVSGALGRTVGDNYAPTVAAKRNRTMSFVADPETDQNFIYAQYIGFANNPDTFCVSDHAPRCPVHIHRRCGKKHYWVPVEAGEEFFKLVMSTAIMREPESAAAPPPSGWEVKLTKVQEPVVKMEKYLRTTLYFDKKVPNVDSRIVFDLENGKSVHAELHPTETEGKATGKTTKSLDIVWRPDQDKLTLDDLKSAQKAGTVMRIYSTVPPPAPPAKDSVLQRISTEVNQIRINVSNSRR